MNELTPLQRRVLVEKHLISPNLAGTEYGACLLSESEHISVMLNEEDHIRFSAYFQDYSYQRRFKSANQIDNWIEKEVEYALMNHLDILRVVLLTLVQD